MNKFDVHFDDVRKFLQAKGIATKVKLGRKASASDLKQFHAKTGIILPDSFSSFYTGYANGLVFTWMKTDEIGVYLSIPTLKQLAVNRRKWSQRVAGFADDPNSMDSCLDPKFRTRAFLIWEKMKNWLPFVDEGNGDHFCLDLANEQIVYDQHAWFDGFGSLAKTNGILAGRSLSDFVENWSRFCFLNNERLWWGEFNKHGAIKWEAKFFNREFYRKH